MPEQEEKSGSLGPDKSASLQIPTVPVLTPKPDAPEEATDAPGTAGESDSQGPDWSALLSFFLAGGVAGAASRTVVSPLERYLFLYFLLYIFSIA